MSSRPAGRGARGWRLAGQRLVDLDQRGAKPVAAAVGGARTGAVAHQQPQPGEAVDVSVRFEHAGGALVRLAPRREGIAGALAAVLAPVALAAADGTGNRVRACAADDCRWAYDQSRNRSGRWCEMAVCGNRTRVRSHRQRTRRT